MHVEFCDNTQQVAQYIANAINSAVGAGRSVLWLISGGSTIPITVATQRILQNPKAVTIMQVDERYGKPGHKDSNWQRLLTAGIKADSFAHAYPVLQNQTFEQTTEDYDHLLQNKLQEQPYVIGLFGIGEDGHTAGLLPSSRGLADMQSYVTGYSGPDFMRISIAPRVFPLLDMAVAYAAGKPKAPAIAQLQQTVAIELQPAQLLKEARNAVLFTDQIKENV